MRKSINNYGEQNHNNNYIFLFNIICGIIYVRSAGNWKYFIFLNYLNYAIVIFSLEKKYVLHGAIGAQRATNCNIELTYEMGERSNLRSFGPNNCSNKMYSLGCFRCFRVKRSPHKNLSKLFRNCHKV